MNTGIYKISNLTNNKCYIGDAWEYSVNRVKIIQLDKNNQIIKIWESITDAAKNLNLHDSNIVSACKGKLKTSGGFKWKYQ